MVGVFPDVSVASAIENYFDDPGSAVPLKLQNHEEFTFEILPKDEKLVDIEIHHWNLHALWNDGARALLSYIMSDNSLHREVCSFELEEAPANEKSSTAEDFKVILGLTVTGKRPFSAPQITPVISKLKGLTELILSGPVFDALRRVKHSQRHRRMQTQCRRDETISVIVDEGGCRLVSCVTNPDLISFCREEGVDLAHFEGAYSFVTSSEYRDDMLVWELCPEAMKCDNEVLLFAKTIVGQYRSIRSRRLWRRLHCRIIEQEVCDENERP